MPEISDAQYQELVGAHRLMSALVNGEHRGETLKLFKKLNPKAPIPEIDAAEPVLTEVTSLKKQIESLQKKLDDDKQDTKLQQQFDRLSRERGITTDGLEKIKTLMVEKAIADPEAAADHWERLNPKPEPIQPAGWVGSSFMDVEGDKELEPWLQNEDRASDQEIATVINEYRSGAVKF
jgi:predicted RNase H-like nuclease (RuvC/YqgF family)